MKDLAGARAMLKGYEGNVPYMYLDSRGLVTVGVGFLLKTAYEATLFTFWKVPHAATSPHRPHNLPGRRIPLHSLAGLPPVGVNGGASVVDKAQLPSASSEEIKREWTTVKSKPYPHTSSYYKPPLTTMTMSQPDIDTHLNKNISQFEGKARNQFPEWDKFPSAAQLALLDMMYNLGSLAAFPSLVAAAQKKNWATCALECHRSGPNQQRNDETRDRFLTAAKEQPFVSTPHTAI